ncbi:MAG: aminoglycoside phosphotransferase family protein [Mesorhizobium sp.]|nr:aminoglycoside phosphotransferase family protein [Mesorhizobium sp.]
MTSEEGRRPISLDLVRRLIASQFPHWADLPVEPVIPGGWNNWTFRLGEQLVVRLPSAERYVAQVEKEQHWLPILARALPLPIPEPSALGTPGEGYPWPWSVYRWIEGAPADGGRIADMGEFASDLGRFLAALRGVGTAGAPPAGRHNFFRGGDLAVYADETEGALTALGAAVDQAGCRAVWRAALSSSWQHAPVWVHGDVSAGNVLVREGRLAAVIDFGSSAIGDPACDLYIAWTFLDAAGRAAFSRAIGLDRACWARGRGWALWKALIVLAGRRDGADDKWAGRVVSEIIADHALDHGEA